MSDAPRRGPKAGPPASRTSPGSRPPAGGPAERRTLSDGRVQMLVYLPPAVVKAVKRAALEQDTSASHVVEQALDAWLAPAGGGRARGKRGRP